MYYPIDRGALKQRAKELMREGKVSPVKMMLLYYAITAALAAVTVSVVFATAFSSGTGNLLVLFFSILVSLVSVVLSTGYTCFCLGLWRGERMPYGSLFDGFSFVGKIIALNLVMSLFIWLWSMLFIIPGIIAMYRYSFAIYNLCENPELDIMQALEMSKQQTRGYKMELFLLQLSFIGWALLTSLPQSIAEGMMSVYLADPSGVNIYLALALVLVAVVCQIFLQPYMQLSYAGFYLRATGANENGEEPVSPPPPEF